MLFKDPKTDDGMKKSQRGRVFVFRDQEGNVTFKDGLLKDDHIKSIGLLEPVFENGELIRNQSLQEIRELLSKQG